MLLVLLLASACASTSTAERVVPGPPTSSTTSVAALETQSTPSTTLPPSVEVRYRIEVRSPDPALADFPTVVAAVLTDSRGWQQAGFRLVRAADAPFAVILAEPDDAHELCRPYDVYRRYSCQNGPLVVLNAERWREATPQWTGDLPTYRAMLVNHEFGHLLGQKHPEVQCPAAGQPAPIMAQQSTELDGCLPNPWPLPHEIARAARHDLPLAPPFEPD